MADPLYLEPIETLYKKIQRYDQPIKGIIRKIIVTIITKSRF